MREGFNGTDRLLIDPAPLESEAHRPTSASKTSPPTASCWRTTFARAAPTKSTVRFFDVDADTTSATPLPLARYFGVAVTPDQRTVYYSKQMHGRVAHLPPQRRRRRGGEALRRRLHPRQDRRDSASPTTAAGCGAIVSYGSAGDEDGHLPQGPRRDEVRFKTVVNDLDARTDPDFAGDNAAPRDELERAERARDDRRAPPIPARANWREIVPENKNAAIQGDQRRRRQASTSAISRT